MEATTQPAAEQQPDPMAEINAMTAIAQAFRGLSPGQIHRALEWANKHYLDYAISPTKRLGRLGATTALDTGLADGLDVPDAPDFPSLLGASRAESGLDRALLSGYHLQIVQGQGDFDGFSANKELKNAGHASGNITRDLDALMSRSPQLVIQTRKQGNSKQARKLYRLTAAGIAQARALLATLPE